MRSPNSECKTTKVLSWIFFPACGYVDDRVVFEKSIVLSWAVLKWSVRPNRYGDVAAAIFRHPRATRFAYYLRHCTSDR